MLTRPSRYAEALAYPHSVYVRVDVHSGAGTLLLTDLPFIGGGVEATLTSRVARRLNLTVAEAYYPVKVGDLLGPFGNELRVYRGLTFGDGSSVVFPVFRGRINTVSLADSGTVTVEAIDRAGDIGDADFEAPHRAIAGPIVDEYRRLIVEALPDATFGVSDSIDGVVPTGLVWESDRSRALDDLAAAGGAFWYPIADGSFVLRLVQWAQSYTPLFVLSDGPAGTVFQSESSQTRENVANSITVRSERTDGSPPIQYTARDTNPASPTSVNGNYGLKARQLSLQTVSSAGQAQTAAETLLRRSRALVETWSVECVPDASIELGDTVRLNLRGRSVIQVVASFSLPLAAQGTMTITFRAQIPGAT